MDFYAIDYQRLMKPLFEGRYIEPGSDRISYLLGLLGPAVLLPWPSGTKGDRRKWKHLQLGDMNEARHLAKLERAPNIGVALGQVSKGLVTIDLDESEYVVSFLGVNPLLGGTLRTRANRGCNLWIRCSGGYPPSQKLKNSSGIEIGEWRADGNQTIISGTHPEGMLYQFAVERPVITVSYDAIIWPQSILLPRATESNRVRGVRENEVVANCGAGASCSSIQVFCTEDLIFRLAPTGFGQNNTSLFKLARLVKSYEDAIASGATDQERQAVFDRWCRFARRFWRHSRDDYYAEFLDACHYALIGLDQDPIELAVSRARSGPLPQLAGFTDDRIRLLVAICSEMQQITRANSFFLPTRKLAEILGAHWTQVARWLRILEKPWQVIHLAPGEVRRPGGTRSPRYHYGPSTQNHVEITAINPNPPSSPLLNGVPGALSTHQTTKKQKKQT
jgi:Bifunctional DNA primase/polymerase, N-terminal